MLGGGTIKLAMDGGGAVGSPPDIGGGGKSSLAVKVPGGGMGGLIGGW